MPSFSIFMRKKDDAPSAPKPPPPEAKAVTDLGMLEALSSIRVEVVVAGQAFVFEGRRLKPAQSKEVQLLLQSALPPVIGTDEDKEPRYDFSNLEYRRAQEENKRKARALALWEGFPVFRARAVAAQPPKTADEIQAFIEGMDVDDDVLETLFRALTARTVTAGYVGFTSGSNSHGG